VTADNTTHLAQPFAQIFVDWAEANWAFDWLRDTVKRLGISGPYDPRFALTLPHRSGKLCLHLNFGGWLVLGFRGPGLTPQRVEMALLADQVSWDERFTALPSDPKEGEPEVRSYHLPMETVRPLTSDLQAAYETTLDFIATKFQTWKRSTHWKQHNPEIVEALFDSEKRERLFAGLLDEKELRYERHFTAFHQEIGEEEEIYEVETELNPEYSLAQFAEDTGFDETELARWVRAIERKKQAILYGPPGTGKTYLAEKLAQHLISGEDGFADLVQFHPAYAYEDFIQGLRPQARLDGGLDYPLVPGRFLEFCQKARNCRGRCVLIIDEINRANLARVFGELMYLLEYREREIPLAGGGALQIPANVRLIGTMNTADRSIALVDHALRRRFAFIALAPNYDVLRRYHQQKQTGFPVENLIDILNRLNQQIGDAHYAVGITFFLHENLAEQIEDIWRMEIEPYLEEYFFDQPEKVTDFRWEAIEQKVLGH
jgi:hypothetical protein